MARRKNKVRVPQYRGQRVRIAAPTRTVWDVTGDEIRSRRFPGGYAGQITVEMSKPPKLGKFRPGNFVDYKGQLYEIMYIYRISDESNVWRYALAERKELRSGGTSAISAISAEHGEGNDTPRIVYDAFLTGSDALLYFTDIPMWGSSLIVRHPEMLNNAQIVSSGEVIPPTS